MGQLIVDGLLLEGFPQLAAELLGIGGDLLVVGGVDHQELLQVGVMVPKASFFIRNTTINGIFLTRERRRTV